MNLHIYVTIFPRSQEHSSFEKFCRAQSNQQTVSRIKIIREHAYKWKSTNYKKKRSSCLSSAVLHKSNNQRERALRTEFHCTLAIHEIKESAARYCLWGRRSDDTFRDGVLLYQESERRWALKFQCRWWNEKRVRAAAAHSRTNIQKNVEITQRCFHLRKMLSLPLIVRRWKKRETSST